MPFENRARFIATLAAPLALVGLMVMASALTRNGPKEFADKVIMADDKAPDMQAAFAKARKTLDTFLQTAANPPGDARHFSLKVAVIEGKTGEWF